MVTHYGLSGPAVLNLSSHFLSALKGKSPEGARLILDLLPEESREETEAYLLEEQKKQSHRKMKNVKFSGIPQAGVRVLLEKSGIDPDEESGVLKKKERGRLISGCGDHPGRNPDEGDRPEDDGIEEMCGPEVCR